jgi:hypothetical protein
MNFLAAWISVNPQITSSSLVGESKNTKARKRKFAGFFLSVFYFHSSQFSMFSPGYFSKSFKLLATKVTSSAFACAAINLSS